MKRTEKLLWVLSGIVLWGALALLMTAIESQLFGAPAKAGNLMSKPRLKAAVATADLLPGSPITNSVTLAWDHVTDMAIIGYRIYYGSTSANKNHVALVTNLVPASVSAMRKVANAVTFGAVSAAPTMEPAKTTTITGIAGTNYFVATAFNQFNESDTSNEIEFTASPVQDFSLLLEAESAVLTSPMILSMMGGRQCVVSPVDEMGFADIPFTVPSDGPYYVWGCTWSTNSANDSLYVSFDGRVSAPTAFYASTNYGSWQWKLATNVTLTAGTHTVTFGGREAWTFLDSVLITSRTNPPTVPRFSYPVVWAQTGSIAGGWADWKPIGGLTNLPAPLLFRLRTFQEVGP